MKRFNRVLSLIICFAMVAISVPGISLVSADLEYKDSITVTDNMGYASFADAVNWSLEKEDGYVEAGVENGNITYTQIQEKALDSSGNKNGKRTSKITYKFPKVTLAEDTVNKTRITTDDYKGKVELKLTYAPVLEDDSGAWSYFKLAGDAEALQGRVAKTVTSMYSPAASVGGLGFDEGQRIEVYTVDTSDMSISLTGNGKTKSGKSSNIATYLDEFSFSNLQRHDAGSKITFEKVEINYTPSLSDADKDKFESLKAKLVDDVDNVTENIDLSGFEGVTWTSTNEGAISSTGKVTQKIGQTQNATLIATFEVDGVTYNKEYDMVVAAGAEVTPDPDPGETPESGVVVMPDGTIKVTEPMGYASVAAALANGWSYEESDYTSISVDADGNLVHTQTIQGTEKTLAGKLTYKFPEITVLEDTVNNTVLKTNNYRGEATVGITFLSSLADKDSWYDIRINGGSKYAVAMESRKEYCSAKNSSYSGLKNVDGSGKNSMFVTGERNAVFTINTDTKAVTATVKGQDRVVSGTSKFDYISDLTLHSTQQVAKDAYTVIKGITIDLVPQELSADEIAEINTVVPETLASADGKVYENLNLSAYKGVTWKSSDASVITDEGKVTRVKNQEKTVDLTATFTAAGMTFTKTYTLTVAAGNNTVNFYSGSTVYTTQDVATGEKAVKPADPVKEGFVFIAWYKDALCTEEYDFNTVVTDDLNLYAKFKVDSIPGPDDSFVSGVVVMPDGTFRIREAMGYTSFAEATNWYMAENDFAKAVIDADGSIKYEQIKEQQYKNGSTTTNNGNRCGALRYTFPEITLDEDAENKTRITTNNYKGKVEFDITYDNYIVDEDGSNPFPLMGLGGNTNILQIRAFNKQSQVYYNGDKIKVGNISSANSRKETYVFDYDNNSVSASDGSNSVEYAPEEVTENSPKFMSYYTVDGMQRCDVGTYLTIRAIEIRVKPSISDAENAKFASLKDKLVDEVDNVTENIDLSGFEGVTWTSTNEAAISSTGVVTRKLGETQNVTLIATFEVDGVTYNKEYDMVVAEGTEDMTDPDPGETPDPGDTPDPDDKLESGIVVLPDGTTQINEFMGYKSFAQAQANGWSYEESDYTSVSVNADGNIVHKQIAENSGTTAVGKLVYKFPELVVLEDKDNNTVVKTNNYRGNVEATIAYSISSTEKGSAYKLAIGGDATNAINVTAGYSSYTARDSSSSTLQESGGVKTSIFLAGNRNTYFTMNSITKAVTAFEEKATGKYKAVSGTSKFEFVSEIHVTAAQNTPLDSYMVLSGITVECDPQTLSADEIAEINTIVPETFASADGKVYEDINLSAYKDVTWKSSDTNILTDDGIIKKVKGQENTVELTATFKLANGITLTKVYTLTIAAGNNTVMFYNEGVEYNYQDVITGNKVARPADPAKEGYTFVGWYTDALLTEAYDFESTVSDDLNLYAKFKINTYKVYFRVNSFIDESLTIEVVHNTAVGTLPAVPQQPGRTPIGWVIENSGNQFITEDAIITSELYVDAAYSEAGATQYKVTFMNGTEVHAEIYAWAGYTVTFPEELPYKENYSFVRWERSGVEFKETELMIAKDIVIDAVFTPNPVEVNFYTDENTLHTTAIGYYDTVFGTLPDNPAISGKAFNGWKMADGTIFNAESIVTGPTNVYAVWGTPHVIIDEDITTYTAATTGLIKFDIPENVTVTASFNDGLRIYQSAWEPLNASGAKNATFGTDFIGHIRSLISEDADNRNKVFMNSLVGEYELELQYEFNQVNPTEYNGVSLGTSFWQMYTGKSTGDGSFTASPYTVRLQNITGKSGSSTIYYGSTSAGSLPFESTFKYDHSYTLHFNTYTSYATAWNDNPANTPKGGKVASIANAIDVFSVSNIFRTGIGSFFVLKNVKVTEYYTDRDSIGYKQSMGVIEKLPAKLGDEDPNAITKDIVMPDVEGVVWTSSDESIVTADGKVTPWYDDTDIVLTATATSEDGAYVYSKEYIVTVKGFITQKQNITVDANVDNWTFDNLADIQEAKYSVEADGGLKIEKITAAKNDSNIRENKSYYAYLDLYGEVSSDEFTTTSTNTYAGVYDITMDIENNITSLVPMNIALGYKSGSSFFSTATLKLTKDSIKIYYPDSGETIAYAVVYAAAKSPAKLKVRIDTNQNLLSVWFDDELIFKNYPYVSPFPAASGCDMFSTIRIGVDSNNNVGDYITVKDVKFEKLLSEEFGIVNQTLAVANGIKAEDLFVTPNNVTGNLTLPKTIGDYAVEWSTHSEQIDVKTGEVFHNTVAKDVVLIAHIYNKSAEYPAYIKKDFNLTIAAGNAAEYGEYLINALGVITNQDYSDIRYDLNLPVSPDVTWSVYPSGIIGNDGKFVENVNVYEPTEVTVTASAFGSKKDYKLIVAPRSGNNVLFTGILPAKLTYGTYKDLRLSHTAMVEFDIENSDKTGKIDLVDNKGNVIMSVIIEEGYFYFDHKGANYAKHMFVNDAPKSVKIMALSDVQKLAIWVDNKLVVDYADYKTNASYFAQAVTNNDFIAIKNFKISTDDYGMLQLNIDNLDYFGSFEKGVIGGDVSLSNSTLTGDVVDWKSGNTEVLTNTGAVNLPSALTVTTLDFKITKADNSNISISKKFDIIVVPDESGNFAKGAKISVSKIENQTFPAKHLNDNNYNTVYRVNGASTSESDITFDMQNEIVLNSMLLVEEAKNIRNITVNVSNDNKTWTPVFTGDMDAVGNGIVKFDIVSAKYIKLTINSADSTIIDINEIKFYLSATAAELAQMDMNVLTLPSTASANLNLVSKGANGSAITWTSSHPSIISSTGVVTRPTESTTVTLTATIIADGQTFTKTFSVYVSNVSSNGPVVVPGAGGGGGGGAGGGGGSLSSNVTIGNDVEEPVYSEPAVSDSNETTAKDSHYADVKDNDWYYDAVMTLTEKGIVSGDGTGAFNPTDKVTREQFLKMLLVAAGVETDNTENTFEDVNTSAWYADYVLTAKKLNLVSGMSATEFGIGAQISRQDMAVFIERLLNIKNISVEKQETESFADAGNVSEYAITAVANMKAIGLIQGYNNHYYPKDSLTRAEAATVIASLLNILSEQ